MTGIPERIYLTPEDAALLGQKYGHPDLQQVHVGDGFVAYDKADARIAELEAELAKSQRFGQEMVAKAASGGVLDGYRELGARAAAAEARAEAAEAKLAAAVAALWSIGHAAGSETKAELMQYARTTLKQLKGTDQ